MKPRGFIFEFVFWEAVCSVSACFCQFVCTPGVLILASPLIWIARAPRPIAFRLRGQDPLLILALGDLQWAWGPFCSFSLFVFFCLSCLLLRLLLSALVLSCPGEAKRDPPYPPLVGSPSLPTPSRIGRMAIRQEGGGGDSFSALWVW